MISNNFITNQVVWESMPKSLILSCCELNYKDIVLLFPNDYVMNSRTIFNLCRAHNQC